MRAKDVDFEVTYINLREKPGWFLEISPHGKVPVLLVDEHPLFESNAIAEYLEEAIEPKLHPQDSIKRARNRAWTDFVPTFASGVSGLYYAKTKEAVDDAVAQSGPRVAKLEEAIAQERGNDGPYFNGGALSLVDAAYAPFLQRFQFIEGELETGLLRDFPLVQAWSDALLDNRAVMGSLPSSFDEEFVGNFKRRGSYVAQFFGSEAAAD